MIKQNKRILVTCVCLFLTVVMICSCESMFEKQKNENIYTDAPATAGNGFVTGAKPETKPEPETEAPPEPTVADEYIALLNGIDHIEKGAGSQIITEKQAEDLIKTVLAAVAPTPYPFGGWGSPAACLRDERNETEGHLDEAYRLLADAGLTFVISQDEWSDPAWTLESLASARRAKLSYWYFSGNQTSAHVVNRVNSMLSSADAEALAAVIVAVDPTEGDLEGIGETSKEIRRELGADSPLKVFSILPPPYAANAGFSSTYRNFLTGYVEACKPHAILTDYALCQGETGNTAEEMLAMLLMERRLFATGSRPLYAAVQCSSSGDTLRMPTLYEMRFNVHAALALGAKSIVYKTACEQEYGNSTGLLDKNGQITETYKQVMAINHEVNAMRGCILYYDFSSVLFLNNEGMVENYKAYSVNTDEVTWGDMTSIKVNGDKFLLVGCLKSNRNTDKEGYYFVNPDVTANTTFTVNFEKSEVIRMWSGRGLDLAAPVKTLTITLGPGEGVFLENMT